MIISSSWLSYIYFYYYDRYENYWAIETTVMILVILLMVKR